MAVRTAMMLLRSFVRAKSIFSDTTHFTLKYAFMLFVILSTMISASAPIVNGFLHALIFISALAIVYFIKCLDCLHAKRKPPLYKGLPFYFILIVITGVSPATALTCSCFAICFTRSPLEMISGVMVLAAFSRTSSRLYVSSTSPFFT